MLIIKVDRPLTYFVAPIHIECPDDHPEYVILPGYTGCIGMDGRVFHVTECTNDGCICMDMEDGSFVHFVVDSRVFHK